MTKNSRYYKKHPAADGDSGRHSAQSFKGDDDFRHHQEWIKAIKATSRRSAIRVSTLARELVEIMLLGCVSLRAGKKIEWDGPNMVATNCPGSRAIHQTSKPRRLDTLRAFLKYLDMNINFTRRDFIKTHQCGGDGGHRFAGLGARR